MSHDFKFKFDRMLENDPTNSGPEEGGEKVAHSLHYPSASHTRNLGFAWPDGRRLFLNYSYLVSGEYKPEQSVVILLFTTHEVTMKGIRLDLLFEELMSHLPRFIRCTEARYNATLEENQFAVNEIKAEKSG